MLHMFNSVTLRHNPWRESGRHDHRRSRKEYPGMGRIVHTIVRLLGGAVAAIVVLLALLALRLSAGPLSLQPALPLIVRAIESATPYRLRIGDAGMLWRDWRRGLLVHASNVIATDDGGRNRLYAKTLAVAFSAEAMAHGVIAPSSINIADADVALARGASDAPPDAGQEDSATDGNSFADLLAGLRSPPDPRRPLSFLFDVGLSDITFALDEPGERPDWRAWIDEAHLARDDANRLGGQAALRIARADEETQATIVLAPAAAADAVSVHLGFSGLRPAAFASVAADLAPLAAIDVALNGEANLSVVEDGAIGAAAIEISGSGGALVLTEALAKLAGFASPEQRLPIQHLSVSASVADNGAQISLQTAEFTFERGTVVYVPSPIDVRYPIAALAANGSFANGRLSVDQLRADVNGLQVTAKASVDSMLRDPSGTLDVIATNVRVNDLRRLWPPKLASGAYDWCTQHLRDGVVPQAHMRLDFSTSNGATEVTSLTGDFGVQRLSVDYLPPMPPVRGATGTATIDLNSLRIAVTSGQADGLTVRQGTIVFPDLNADPPSIDIDLAVSGPVRAAMNLIAHKPLEYPQKIGISPSQTSGETLASVRLRFPLLADLEASNIDISATADLKDAAVTGVAPDIDLTKGQLHLDINSTDLSAKGTLAIAGVNGRLTANQSFIPSADPQTRVEFVVGDVSTRRLRDLLRDVKGLDTYLLSGSLAGKVNVVISSDNRGEIVGAIDIGRAELAVPELGWSKDAGLRGTVDVTLETEGEHLAAVQRIAVAAPNLTLDGSARLRADGGIERIDIDRLATGRTNATATIAHLASGQWDITVGGTGIDLSSLLKSSRMESGDAEPALGDWPDVSFTADVDSAWLSPTEPITNVQATVVHHGGLWSLVQMQGGFSDGSMVDLSVEPDDGAGRSLQLTAGNAGEALRAFGVFTDMIDGRLQAEGTFDDSVPSHPLSGRLKIKDFYIVNTPILARLLNVLALTGIRDALTGRGIYFSKLDFPFGVRAKMVSLENGRAYGSSIGMTVSGTVNAEDETANLQGQLVPFYAVNSVLGRLPLVGGMMTGGEQGGGVFSATYQVSGPLSDPQVSVNPVSVLVPGFLRSIMDTFDGWISSSPSDSAK
jgi:uncharacterized protein YhdP